MKKFLTAIAILVACVNANAGCQEDFDKFKVTATNMLPVQLRSQLSPVGLKIGVVPKIYASMTRVNKIGSIEIVRPALADTSDDWEGELDGRAVYSHETVYVTCNEDAETNRAVIAHELGHFVAEIMNLSSDEDQANIFAAEIFSQSGVDSTNYLKFMDNICSNGNGNGNVYFCRRAEMWRVGLTGG